jgi:hypothetical protein
MIGGFQIVFDELVQNGKIKPENQAKVLVALKPIRTNDPLVLERDRLLPPCQPPKNPKPETDAQREADFKVLFEKRASFKPAGLQRLLPAAAKAVE